jgi:ribonuclease HII
VTFPTLELEIELLKTHSAVIGIDEVGRGSLAGPIAVAAFVLTQDQVINQPKSLQDSKLIRESKRQEVADQARAWGNYSISFVDAQFIDQHGIIAALKSAGLECLARLDTTNCAIVLDGNQNWLELPGVMVRTKADRDCASVAAASILAKVERDALMVDLAKKYPGFAFESNKGYSSDFHIQALRTLGPTDIHRKTWLSNILSEGLF